MATVRIELEIKEDWRDKMVRELPIDRRFAEWWGLMLEAYFERENADIEAKARNRGEI